IVGRSGGAEGVRMTPTRDCTPGLDPAWDLGPTGWRGRVRGDAPFDPAMPVPIPPGGPRADTPADPANRPVNTMPHAGAAPPGILSTFDLPPITPAGPPTT